MIGRETHAPNFKVKTILLKINKYAWYFWGWVVANNVPELA